MKKTLTFAFVGGDLRQIRVANLISKDEHNVRIYGFDMDEPDDINDSIIICGTLDDVVRDADVIVLPLPYTSGDDIVKAPFSKNKIYIIDVLRKIQSNQILFIGKADEKILALSQVYNIHSVDYFDREELAVQNAIPTCEGALAIAINETSFTLHGSKCLVLGHGRIGKVLARSLHALGSNTSVFARKYHDLAWVKAFGFEPISSEKLPDVIEKFDIIFNTVPYVMLDFKLLSKLKKNCLVIDLASKPGGVDFEMAKELGVNVICAFSLPGKVAPTTAGDIIKETIVNILNELGV